MDYIVFVATCNVLLVETLTWLVVFDLSSRAAAGIQAYQDGFHTCVWALDKVLVVKRTVVGQAPSVADLWVDIVLKIIEIFEQEPRECITHTKNYNVRFPCMANNRLPHYLEVAGSFSVELMWRQRFCCIHDVPELVQDHVPNEK